jgi:hypothetical protein
LKQQSTLRKYHRWSLRHRSFRQSRPLRLTLQRPVPARLLHPRLLTQERTGDTALRYRTGPAEAVWQADFTDGDVSNVSDFYAWEGPFNTVEEIDGVLTMSDPAESDWAAMWIDTGLPEDHFPAGSIIQAKIRLIPSNWLHRLPFHR